MMSIFGTPFCAPQTQYYSSEPSLVPLFRLLDDFDQYSRELQHQEPAAPQPKRRRQSPAPLPRFKPKFDIRETETTYELHGELPGIEKENLNIEFTDPRTIEIRGRVERTKEQQPQPEEKEEQQHPEVTEPATSEPEKTNTNNHHATVEDDPEEMETSSTTSWTPVSSPKPEAAKPANTEVTKTNNNKSEVEKAAPKEVAKKTNNAGKIWLWERSIGEFSRVFEFPGDVDHDGVSASLNNGVLTVTVPKKNQRGPRRIAIL